MVQMIRYYVEENHSVDWLSLRFSFHLCLSVSSAVSPGERQEFSLGFIFAGTAGADFAVLLGRILGFDHFQEWAQSGGGELRIDALAAEDRRASEKEHGAGLGRVGWRVLDLTFQAGTTVLQGQSHDWIARRKGDEMIHLNQFTLEKLTVFGGNHGTCAIGVRIADSCIYRRRVYFNSNHPFLSNSHYVG